MLDIGTSCEDTLQVHPVSLDVNSHVKCSVYLVQSLLSSQSFVFKNLLKIYVWSIFKLHYTQKSLAHDTFRTEKENAESKYNYIILHNRQVVKLFAV